MDDPAAAMEWMTPVVAMIAIVMVPTFAFASAFYPSGGRKAVRVWTNTTRWARPSRPADPQLIR